MKKLFLLVVVLFVASSANALNPEKSFTGEKACMLYDVLNVEPEQSTDDTQGALVNQKILSGLTCTLWGMGSADEQKSGCWCKFAADLTNEQMSLIYLLISVDEEFYDGAEVLFCEKIVGDMIFKRTVGSNPDFEPERYYFSILAK